MCDCEDYETDDSCESPQSKLWRSVYLLGLKEEEVNPTALADRAVWEYNNTEYLDD